MERGEPLRFLLLTLRPQSKTWWYDFKGFHVCVFVTQSCPTLCDSMYCHPPGSSVCGISQARIVEWVAMPSSRGSSLPRDRTCVSYVSYIGRWVLYHQHHLGSPDFDYLELLNQKKEHELYSMLGGRVVDVKLGFPFL